MTSKSEQIYNAAANGDSAELSRLLKDATKQDLSGAWPTLTALMEVARLGRANIAELLCQAGADVQHQRESDGWNALMWASMNGHTETARVLLNWNTNVNALAKDGSTALMIAARNGHPKTVQLLLEAGADRAIKRRHDGKAAEDQATNVKISEQIRTFKPYVAAAAPTPPSKKTADPIPPSPAAAPTPAPAPVPTPAPARAAAGEPERVLLEKECDALAQQAALAPSHMEAVQQRGALQQQYDAAFKVDDFERVGLLGQQLEDLNVQPLPLPADLYLSLRNRHVMLVQRVTAKCRAMTEVKDFAGVRSLGAKLALLKALDLSAVPPASDSDPAYVPPTITAAAAAAQHTEGQPKEGEEPWANDPVYVPNTGAAASAAGAVQISQTL